MPNTFSPAYLLLSPEVLPFSPPHHFYWASSCSGGFLAPSHPLLLSGEDDVSQSGVSFNWVLCSVVLVGVLPGCSHQQGEDRWLGEPCTFSWLASSTPTQNIIGPFLQRVRPWVNQSSHPRMATDGIVCQRSFRPFPSLNCIREESVSLVCFHMRFFFEDGDWDKKSVM